MGELVIMPHKFGNDNIGYYDVWETWIFDDDIYNKINVSTVRTVFEERVSSQAQAFDIINNFLSPYKLWNVNKWPYPDGTQEGFIKQFKILFPGAYSVQNTGVSEKLSYKFGDKTLFTNGYINLGYDADNKFYYYMVSYVNRGSYRSYYYNNFTNTPYAQPLPIRVFKSKFFSNGVIDFNDIGENDCKYLKLYICVDLANAGAIKGIYAYGDYADITGFKDIYTGYKPGPIPGINPYEPGGTSTTGGGGGNFDSSSDPVDFPGLPTLSASRCGLITMFNPTVSELQQLSTKMWSKDFFDNVTKLISNPIDIIVALTIVPVSPPVSGREEVIAGLLSTGVSMNVVSSQYMSFSCGTYTVENFYDAALDYAPYTKASIYLPYIGVRQLNVDEIMGATLEIKYNIDLFTGACVAMIKVNNAVLYSFDGNIATQIPVNAANYASLYSSLIQGVASIATTAVTGGATAPSLAAQAASFAVNAVTSSKPTIQRAGGITGSNGLMAIQTPFLIFEIPRQSLPDSQQVYTGYPSNITYKLADLSGFTQVSDIHLDGIPATSEELTEIERLLKEGVII